MPSSPWIICASGFILNKNTEEGEAIMSFITLPDLPLPWGTAKALFCEMAQRKPDHWVFPLTTTKVTALPARRYIDNALSIPSLLLMRELKSREREIKAALLGGNTADPSLLVLYAPSSQGELKRKWKHLEKTCQKEWIKEDRKHFQHIKYHMEDFSDYFRSWGI